MAGNRIVTPERQVVEFLEIDFNIMLLTMVKDIKNNWKFGQRTGNLGRELETIRTDRVYTKRKQLDILELKHKITR